MSIVGLLASSIYATFLRLIAFKKFAMTSKFPNGAGIGAVSQSTSNLLLSPYQKANANADDAAPILFLFLEVFSQEGGIQSYVKDIFGAYNALEQPPRGDVFLLRDHKDCDNKFTDGSLTFHYFHTRYPAWGRIRMAIALFLYLWQQRP
ncbi:MAG: hypothetical protein F6K09_37770, partial [Merismopedia sp. SIO2A8]|nr:hypothetical protein [Merismopedia sp. SIO2A8]